MKKFLSIATPILCAVILIFMLLVPGNACVEHELFYFADFYKGETGFWSFLFSPFPALLFSAIATLTVLISSCNRGKSLFAVVLWNGYYLLQALIHLHDFYGVQDLNGVSATGYYVYTAVFGALYLFTVVLHILRARQNLLDEQREQAELAESAIGHVDQISSYETQTNALPDALSETSPVSEASTDAPAIRQSTDSVGDPE